MTRSEFTSNGSSPKLDRPDWNYEETVAEVEAIISRLEMGELELADVFEQFTKAIDRLHQCEAFLNHQQQQMDLLVETLLDEPDF
ncbi:exodeoxyribonuclease VII small subunit [Microcoleus sp. FACHB-1515]|uniref:exodeoxyribonuclease VII small subunit n=1 Tax=Cyanophyceae TaxID=3028117 RepID=UPI0016832378|nr:exodeoxyribonuclease VII small subunit [Microcoleus sp. FACHB-1515]MBD2089475.1 exodeoxyribonuclease VII small subunit [Microcoleus sp. FACHB-1515]